MSALIFDKDTLQSFSPESYDLASIQPTFSCSVSCQEGLSHQKHRPSAPSTPSRNPIGLRSDTLCSLLKNCHQSTKASTESVNKSYGELRLKSRTTGSKTTEVHMTEIDSSNSSQTCSEVRHLDGITVNLSKSMIEKPKEEATPNKLFLSKDLLRPEFVQLCQDFLVEQFCSKRMTESWDLARLYSQFKSLPFPDPFIEPALPQKPIQLESVSNLFEGWIFNYAECSDIILSFDFLMNHQSMILSLVFYWVKSEDPVSPMISPKERSYIIQSRNSLRHNIVKIMKDEIILRGLELHKNHILGKLLTGFFKYATDNPPKDLLPSLNQALRETWRILIKQASIEEEIKKTMSIESKHDANLLEQIYDNYQNKDKLIKDRLSDIVEMFTETDKSLILLTPLSDYFGIGMGENSLKDIGNRYNKLSCWLMSLVIQKSKSNGKQALEYVIRYIELLKEFEKVENYQSAILFGGIISNIRGLMPELWNRAIKSFGKPNIQQTIADIINNIQRPIFSERVENSNILFSNTQVFKLVESARAKFHKQYFNINFHKRIQTIAKNVLACRKVLELPYEIGKKYSKMNLNQKFIGIYIYEILHRESTKEVSSQFQELKKQAKKADKSMYFPILSIY